MGVTGGKTERCDVFFRLRHHFPWWKLHLIPITFRTRKGQQPLSTTGEWVWLLVREAEHLSRECVSYFKPRCLPVSIEVVLLVKFAGVVPPTVFETQFYARLRIMFVRFESQHRARSNGASERERRKGGESVWWIECMHSPTLCEEWPERKACIQKTWWKRKDTD